MNLNLGHLEGKEQRYFRTLCFGSVASMCRAIWVSFLIFHILWLLPGCDLMDDALDYTLGEWKEPPRKPVLPDNLFLLRWNVAGQDQEMTWEKMEDERRWVDAENVGMLYPAGADGDLLSIFYTDPIIGYPAVLHDAWHDTVNVSDGESQWQEIWTYEITDVDTTLAFQGQTYHECFEITGTNDVTRCCTFNYFAPEIGMTAFYTSYSGTEGYLIARDIRGNQTKDGFDFGKDCLPMMVGNEWTYLMPGSSFDYVNSYKLVE